VLTYTWAYWEFESPYPLKQKISARLNKASQFYRRYYMTQKKDTKWKKGQSGNPSGRPKGSKGLAAKIREATGDYTVIIEKLMAIIHQGNDREAIQAARELLDRGLGKPTQQVDVEKTIDINLNIPEDIEEEI
jgi:hypothetical protein